MSVINIASNHGADGVSSFPVAASGNDRVLVAYVMQGRNPLNVSTLSFNAVAGTTIGTQDSGDSQTRVHARYWLDADLPASAASYNLTSDGTSGTKYCFLVYAEGVDQAAFVEFLSGNSAGTTVSHDLTTADAGALCVFGMAHASVTGTATALTDVTLAVARDAQGSPSRDYFGGYSILTSLVGCTVGATGVEASLAVAFNPAAGGAASITSVTGDGADTVRAGESFTIVGTGFEASRGAGMVTVGGVAVDSYTSWNDTTIVAVAPTDGLLFGGSKTIEVTPDSNTADDITGQTYLPPTGFDYMTFDSGGISGMTIASVGWNSATSGPYTGLTAGDQYYYDLISLKVDGAGDPVDPEVTATAVVEEGTGDYSVADVPEPGDYIIYGFLRDGDGTDSALDVILDSTAPSGYSVSIDQGLIDESNETALSFTFAGAEVGASYEYTITSSGGGTPVTDTGTISTATDQITSIDVSGLGDGNLTLSVILSDAVGNDGTAATDTVNKDAIAGTPPSLVRSIVRGICRDVSRDAA